MCLHGVAETFVTDSGDCLDREAISSAVGLSIRPLSTLCDLWSWTHDSQSPSNFASFSLNGVVEISYADFSPNKLVVDEVALQFCERTNTVFKPVVSAYSDLKEKWRTGNFDVIYMIVPAPFPDPTSFLLLYDSVLTPEVGLTSSDRIELFEILGISNFRKRAISCRDFSRKIQKGRCFIPILQVVGSYLRSQNGRQVDVLPSGAFSVSNYQDMK